MSKSYGNHGNHLYEKIGYSKLFQKIGFFKGIWQLEQENEQGPEILRQQEESLVNILHQKSRNLITNKRINVKDESIILGFTAQQVQTGITINTYFQTQIWRAAKTTEISVFE